MVFVFDIDDTMCDTDGYSEEYIKGFIKKHNLPIQQIGKISRFAEAKFDWNEELALAWYKAFGDQMMLEFPCKEGVKKVLQRLHDDGHRIIIATARANDWHYRPIEITEKWLLENDIPYDKLYIGRVDKEKICEEENADIFVDDDIKILSRVAAHFAESGNPNKQAYLATTEYNKNLEVPTGVTRIANFEELYGKVFKKEEEAE